MAHDPLTHVAAWLTPTPDADTLPATAPSDSKAVTADDKIVSLFHDWIAAESNSDTVLDASGEDSAEYEAAVDRITELEYAIADAPSASTAGVAIKAYLTLSIEVAFCKGDAEQFLDKRLAQSTLDDIIRLAPVLAPLAAAAIAEHAAARGWAP
jgi:hypothetical protein